MENNKKYMNEKDFLKDFIQLAININKEAGIDITDSENEILQRARWGYLMNKLGSVDNINVLTNLVKQEIEDYRLRTTKYSTGIPAIDRVLEKGILSKNITKNLE